MASRYNITFDTEAQYDTFKASSGYVEPNVSYVTESNVVHYNPIDYSTKYLTFVATESGAFKFSGNSINYSLDDGTTWTSLASNTDSPTVSAGSKIMWKATGLTPTSLNGIGRFSSSRGFTVEGNVMSLLYGDDFIGQTSLSGKDYALYKLFNGCTRVTSAESLSLPATTLAIYCYSQMFQGCTSLTTAPELPATALENNCYSQMFYGCSGLTTAPSSIGDSNTAMATYACASMFSGCTSLTTAPELPATTLAERCYQYMFYDCTSLNSITCLATDISEYWCTRTWVYRVASSGTFTKAASMTNWTTGTSGIPSNWTVVDAS